MEAPHQEVTAEIAAAGSASPAGERELRVWVEHAMKGTVVDWSQISGGNRCLSWAIRLSGGKGPAVVYLRYQPPLPPSAEPYTVWRESQIYKALSDTDVMAPRLLAVHPHHQAIITELKPGRADFRSLADDGERTVIAREFVEAIARLHMTPFPPGILRDLKGSERIADCVRVELDTWYAMYAETGSSDPLIEFAMEWLHDNLPDPNEAPVLVHGDAGPGNFLFDDGHLTALIDWELAHPGDPMEDIAWFSMRSVMEPVPDFIGNVRHYEKVTGKPVDLARILYHRVFVSARVVIIRHRNVTGLPGNSIVSKSLNRRLLVDALGEASGVVLAAPQPLVAEDTLQTSFYDGILDALRDDIAGATDDANIIAAAKNNAKVVKFLREVDRLGALVAQSERSGLAAILGHPVTRLQDGREELLQAMRERAIPFDRLLQFFADIVAREAQLAALTSGGLATRRLPKLDSLR